MQRIIATYIKEWHLMRRDLGGLALLFLMPVILIIIMALVQDAPFKDYRDHKFEAVFVNEDGGKVAASIRQGLLDSKQFELIESHHHQPIDLATTQNLIQKGTYQFAILVPKGISAEVVNSANLIANEMGRQMGLPASLPHRESREGMSVQLMFDPVCKPAFRLAINNVVEKFITKIQSDIVLERIAKLSQKTTTDTGTFDIEKQLRSVSVKEISSNEKKLMVSKMNSVQHNVPAWAIFGMFFMIIIIADSIINERLGGSWTRLKLIPGSFSHILIGKMLFYVLLGIIQFYLMLLVGIYVMPLVGLPSLQLGHSPFLLLIMVTCLSCCATTFGILIGTIFKTTNQALPVAAISVVILSAIGGVWVPVEVLPDSLRAVSLISPMRWGLQGINNLLLRDCSWKDIVRPCGILLSGALTTLFLSWMIEKKRMNQ
ncbi:hypothetical protein EMGBS15_05580 [Filimonas sp.]|nr:hypothetical protein EMGBS15_05580 [Filimonas sp.]